MILNYPWIAICHEASSNTETWTDYKFKKHFSYLKCFLFSSPLVPSAGCEGSRFPVHSRWVAALLKSAFQ